MWVFIVQIAMIYFFNKSVNIFKSLFFYGENDQSARKKLNIFRCFMSILFAIRALYLFYYFVIDPFSRMENLAFRDAINYNKGDFTLICILSWIPFIMGCSMLYAFQKVARNIHLILILKDEEN